MELNTWFGYVGELLPGLVAALKLTGISLGLGLPLALVLALLVDSRLRVVRWVTIGFVEVGRGLPLLVLLYIFYQGLPQINIVPSALASATWAFTWSAAAYATEIIRSSLRSVPRGQTEAGSSLGLSERDRFRYILLPQASRIAIPPLMGLSIIMFQLTSLAYVITYSEVMQAAYFLGTTTFQYLPVFLAAAFVYAIITIPASALVTSIEKRLSKHL
ncbi:MAG: amino acid ABC transporter permease [Actinobacteria bacterium]|nr:amino acid ABC transporter permease [Actinomycetota bacterium]MBT5183193.1 amino acid ABC transporter permease [Actinomycetota bacterium]MBT5501074.1 amino acid ABC transporter permease [Actinomycetota bacterium]MBT5807579.1 amino acid ABC transporter permease [Actinomycetota bacterium]NQW31502.1 amino acid ABC transporter permease [Actinomycetales bacterium]